MYSSARQLLGHWVLRLVLHYFEDQKKIHSDKLFIKIAGVDDSAWSDVLQAFQGEEDRLSVYYRPIIRTLNKVQQFEAYECKQHETSTWLRNNTASGSALLILMNDISPEAQSLENIFTIDEARLLSPQGLEVLYQYFADIHKCIGDELNALKQFLNMYGRIAEPQLRNVLAFLSAVNQDSHMSMIDKIQQNMDQLLLFRDSKLSFRVSEGFMRLKRNYQLSRLEREGKTVKKDDLIDNLYSFIEKSTASQEEHELWQKVHPDTFRQQALAFIHNQSNELLQYEFDIISNALFFKVKKQKINEKINDFKTVLEVQENWKPEKDQIITDTLEAINDNRNPDKIQEFIDEFSDDLHEYPKLKKDLERIIARQRQLAEYTELSEALLQESIQLLEEFSSGEEEAELDKVVFVLRLYSPVHETIQGVLKFHLLQLNQLTGYIKFDDSSLECSNTQEKDLSFKLQLLVEDQIVSESRFKLSKAFMGALPGMIEHVHDTGQIPYVREYYGSDTKLDDVAQMVKDRVSGYVATGYSNVENAATSIYKFIDWFTYEIKQGLELGLSSMNFKELEARLEMLLSQIHQSALLSKHVLQYINCLGVIDRYDCKISDAVGYAQTRVVTLLNPLRLLSYSKRILRIRDELSNWIKQQQAAPASIDEMKAYLQQKQEETAHLFPRYYVIEGVQDQFLIEQHEQMGEGVFALNGKNSGEDTLVDTFSEEFLHTVKTYLDVYPYARDCLDIVFLYCPHAEYVTNAIDRLFKHHLNVRKVKAIVHCETNGASVHEYLNDWMNQEEKHSERYNSFPRVEIQVIAENSINAMMQSVSQYLLDADIGVLINYFGQTDHIQYKLEKVHIKESDNWFDTIYKEPLKKDDAVKRVSFVSEKMPKVVQLLYKMQYILYSNEIGSVDDHYLLRNVISITKLSDTELINYMHDKFNWSLFIDRYLDKSLLRQVSSKAQIIKYKSKAGNNKDFRTILSSSKYIRKLANELADHEYYDRLHQKYTQLLKNDHIDPQIIVQATERVKEISGAVVLRAIGPGKFAHEMMAIYLATQARAVAEGELVVWSVCDELPWFQGSVRRPDLVRTAIKRDGSRFNIHFELIELKFTSHTIFEKERYDAIKQVKAGLELYHNRFLFNEHMVTASLWLKELIYYLLEYGTYSVEHALLLKELQSTKIDCIDVKFSGSIDSFVYTSNLLELSIMEGHNNGYKVERLHNEYTNYIYNRAYILRALGASQEEATPSYEILEELPAFFTNMLGPEDAEEVTLPSKDNKSDSPQNGEVVEVSRSMPIWSEEIVYKEIEMSKKEAAASIEFAERPNTTIVYPEIEALAGEVREKSLGVEDMLPLVESYQKKLRYNFNQIGIPIKIVESFIGVSVIRLVLEIPIDKSYSSIENKAKDICLWLQLPSIPLIALRKGRINIDINREEPETVYFEDFMELARTQFPKEKLKGKLIAPIGVGQLRELITIDFSSSNTPHLLIGGTTGSGKSVTINSIILAMMCLYEPSDVQFLFIDPKKVEFMNYENRTHTKQVITEIEEAILVLEQLVEEMEQRYSLFARESVMSIDEYVELSGTPLPRLVVVFDEFADFMEREKNLSGRVENAILRLGAKARAAGIHLLICTQNPKADIVPTNIRNNLPARLALKAADHHASKIIINEEGAEKLGGKGDFLIKLEMPEIIRARSPFLMPRIKRALLKYFEKNE